MQKLLIKGDICFSGGAYGAESVWEMYSYRNGHKTVVITFDGHHSISEPTHSTLKILTKNELKRADKYLDEANIYLNRKNYKQNLIRRTYFIIENASKCYAVVLDIGDKTPTNKHMPRIIGGTSWGCIMFILKHIKNIETKKKIPLYIYAENKEVWVTPQITMENGKIINIEYIETDPPKPSGQYAGIGSRDITEVGSNAIQELFKKQ